MDAMLVVDMQVGLLSGKPKHDLHGVVDRINRLAAGVRAQSGKVILIQHCGGKGDDFEPQTPGWAVSSRTCPGSCRHHRPDDSERSFCRHGPAGAFEGDRSRTVS